MLVALREIEAGVAHVGAPLRGHDVERLLRQAPAQVDRNPRAVGVAADLHPLRGNVVDLSSAPVLEVRQLDVRVALQVELERPRVKRLAIDLGGRRYSRKAHSADSPTTPRVWAYRAVPGSSIM